jgi:tRNA A-37 threonylcarbamoyl transferase component Bud32
MVPHGPTPGNDSLPHSRALTVGRAEAAAHPAIADALQQLLAHDVATWPAHGFALVKERTVRLVLRGTLGGIDVHAKVFRPDTFRDAARDLLRGPRGATEARHLQRLRQLGLPAVEPLAHGHLVAGDRRRAFVMTRTVAAAPFAITTAPADVARCVGALLRQLHDRGIAPGDLHPGNLLADTAGALHLIDLTTVQLTGPLDLRQRARALAFFCHELDGGALDPAAGALWRGYREAGPDLPTGLREQLVLATRRWRAGALPAFGRRATRDCKHTRLGENRRGVPRWFWHRPAGDDAAWRAHCEAFTAAPGEPRKAGRRGSVTLGAELVQKERDAGAARSLWVASYWLLFAKVAAPEPVALRTYTGRGQVLLRRLPGPNLATELANQTLTGDEIAAAAADLGTQVGRLHAHGLGNRDLKFDNLVRDRGTVVMVDLDGVRRRSASERRGRGHDLGRLFAAFQAAGCPGGPRTVRNFLRSYLRAHRRLLQQPPLRQRLAVAAVRAGHWASAHR